MFIVTLVSHCEQVWWDPGYDSLRVAVRAVIDLQTRAAQALGCSVSSTFCTFVDHYEEPATIDAAHVPDLFAEVLRTGNELGLHVHAPHGPGTADLQERLAAQDADLIAGSGFTRPLTYTAGDWVVSGKLASSLHEGGFRVDCSVYSLEGPLESDGVVIDHTKRSDLRPYHPSPSDLWSDGASALVELPVSGCLTEFGGASSLGLPPIVERIAERYEASRDSTDVFQIFWHPFDVVTLDGLDNDALLAARTRVGTGKGLVAPNSDVLAPYSEFVESFGQANGVAFASAIEAARIWEQSQSIVRSN